jgi:HEPN superfamily AbiU2-like protein
VTTGPSPLEHELEMFRTEEEAAQQYFFGYLSLQLIPGKNPSVLAKMNDTSTFWITTRYALLMSAFVVLGRIFDQDPKSLHNIDKLLGVVSRDIASLSAAALAQRRIKQGMTPKDAAAYARGKFDLTMDDVRGMRKAVGQCRKVYEARYREIRHKIFAHKSIDRTAADALMANTNVDEVKELLGFLHALHQSLYQLHMNGIKPDITPVKFDLPPAPGGGKPGERIFRESGDLLYGMIDPRLLSDSGP